MGTQHFVVRHVEFPQILVPAGCVGTAVARRRDRRDGSLELLVGVEARNGVSPAIVARGEQAVD